MYGFCADQSCTLNQFFITFNLILHTIITTLCVLPAVCKKPAHALSWTKRAWLRSTART